MIYVLIATPAAESMSSAIYQLMRPAHLRDESYGSAYYCEWRQCVDPAWSVLVLPETEQIPIHMEADDAMLQGLLAGFVAQEALSPEEADAIIDAVQENAGDRVSFLDLIPPSWQSFVANSLEEAQENGWLPAEGE